MISQSVEVPQAERTVKCLTCKESLTDTRYVSFYVFDEPVSACLNCSRSLAWWLMGESYNKCLELGVLPGFGHVPC